MKLRKRCLAPVWLLPLAFVPPTPAQNALPIDEQAIIAEMDQLVDAAAPTDARTARRAQKLLKKGFKAHQRHKYEKALELYQQALDLTPLDARIYFEVAYCWNSLGEQTRALDAAIRAIALDPKQEIYHIIKGSILDDLGFFDEAVATYRRLLEIAPDSYLARVNLGITFLRRNLLDTAEKELLTAVEVAPEAPLAYFHLASLARIRGDDYDEEKYLDAFIERSGRDPRREPAEARLAQLRRIEVALNPNQPHMEIALVEQMLRGLWKASKFRELHPEARGYRETYQEDREIADQILSIWREKKNDDPSVAHARYDLLLRVDDAGFLEEFIWYTGRRNLGEPARKWIEEHPRRIERFEAWARAEGLLKDAPQEGPARQPSKMARMRAYPREVMEAILNSTRSYKVDTQAVFDEDARRREGERMARMALGSGDRVSCRSALTSARKNLLALATLALEPVLRCYRPGDEPYEEAIKMLSRLMAHASEIIFAPRGEVEIDGKTTHIGIEDNDYLMYFLGKAAWHGEKEIRLAHGGADVAQGRPSMAEELFALETLAGGYLNALKQGEEDASAPQQRKTPEFERLLAAIRRGNLRGFALYEVLHKWYGVRLDNLSRGEAQALRKYLQEQVLIVRPSR
ncbi:MAG: tetratricopeptide repeat protein [Acidobacteriota bacterium]|nr:tetratricopeptide repeat protein [Acidobacteriota bacterium]